MLILGLFGLQLLLAFTITAFGVLVAIRVKQLQTFTTVMQMLVMPMFFLSGALYPVSGLPTWLEVLTRLNPPPCSWGFVVLGRINRKGAGPVVPAGPPGWPSETRWHQSSQIARLADAVAGGRGRRGYA